ncbi:MAG: OprO/OprP family phosphate-selective porin [Rhodospirillaceae bacterium]
MKKIKMRGLLVAAVTGLAAIPFNAEAQSQQNLQIQINAMKLQLEDMQKQMEEFENSGDAVTVKWEPAPAVSSPDGKFEMNLRGRILADTSWISDGDNNIDTKATEFRTVRLGIEGKAWKDVKYKFESDFADNEVGVKDAYMEWKAAPGTKIAIGQFKTHNSLDEQTSSRHISVMERASFTDAFGLARRIGVSVGLGDKNWTAKAGLFRGSNGIDEENEGSEVAARVTYSPKVGDVQAHFGASVRARKAGDQSNFRYRQRPHQHLSPVRFVNTGRVANKDLFYGAEIGALLGPFWAVAEYSGLKADANDPVFEDPTFTGGYAEIGFFLTGETRGYKADKGAWDRPKVNMPVHEGGVGAWAITARYDTLDLTEPGFQGGNQNSFIVGVNWYLNRHTRMMLNYNNARIRNAFDVDLNGTDGKNNVDGFGLRAQIDW